MANAVGQIFNKSNCKRAICLMTAQAVDVAAPTLATDGVPNYHNEKILTSDTGACFTSTPALSSTLMIHTNGASAGSLTGVFTLWGYLEAALDWFPIKVNAAAAIAATGHISYSERFLDLGHYDRIALQLASSGGTTPSFEAFLVTGLSGTAD